MPRLKPQRWLELAITVQPELVEPLTELFAKRGKAAVSIEERAADEEVPATVAGPASGPAAWAGPSSAATVTLRAYLPGGLIGKRRRARIEAGIALLGLMVPMPPLRARDVDAEEWESVLRGHFTTLRVGKRLLVCPLWEKYEAQPGEVVLLLDPGASFGTGHHPTTRLCLQLLESRVRPGIRVLDVGTGSGILAIAAAKLGAATVVGVDTDPLAVRMARRNVRTNGVQDRVKALRGTIPLAGEERSDLVVANITSAILEAIMPDLNDALWPGGELILSGVLVPQLPSVLATAGAFGLVLAEQRTEGDWVALVLRR